MPVHHEVLLDVDARVRRQHARLRLARQLNGLKQVALSAEVDLSPAALSQYEHGVHAPSTAVLRRLAFALGFPAAFFHRDGLEPVAAPAFFRSLRGTQQSERDRAAAVA